MKGASQKEILAGWEKAAELWKVAYKDAPQNQFRQQIYAFP